MELPLSALLYKITSMCDYDLQNVNLAQVYNGIHLYDNKPDLTNQQQCLYFLTEKVLTTQVHTSLSERHSGADVFLCYCKGDPVHLNHLAPNLSIVYLIPKHGESYPEVFNRLLTIFQSFHSWNQSFHIEMLHGATMQALLDVTAPILSHPMIVLDANMGIMGYVRKDDDPDLYMERLITHGYMSTDMYKEFQQLGILPVDFHLQHLHISEYPAEDGKHYYSMCYQIHDDKQTNAYVLIFKCRSHPSNSYQYLTDMVAGNLSLYFKQSKSDTRKSSNQYELFLTKLIQIPDQPLQRLESMVNMIDGLTLNGHFLLARVFLSDNETASRSFIVWNLRQSFADLRPFIYNDALYILLVAEDNAAILNHFLPETQLEDFINCFCGFLDFCTVSQPFYALTDLSAAVRQCEAAFDYHVAASEDAPLIYYRDQASSYLQHQMNTLIDATMTGSAFYQTLKQYDEANDTNLSRIVYAYLTHFKSVTHTAQHLDMHRNTIQNNIRKAGQILGTTLSFDDAFFYIMNYRKDHKS